MSQRPLSGLLESWTVKMLHFMNSKDAFPKVDGEEKNEIMDFHEAQLGEHSPSLKYQWGKILD